MSKENKKSRIQKPNQDIIQETKEERCLYSARADDTPNRVEKKFEAPKPWGPPPKKKEK